MRKICGQVNIPEVDNSSESCFEIYTTDCVHLSEDLDVELIKGTPLISVLRDLHNRILVLEKEINEIQVLTTEETIEDPKTP